VRNKKVKTGSLTSCAAFATKPKTTGEAALLYLKATFRSCPVAKSPIAAVATVSVGFSKPAKKRNVKVSQNL
jgi:hypothetical protein